MASGQRPWKTSRGEAVPPLRCVMAESSSRAARTRVAGLVAGHRAVSVDPAKAVPRIFAWSPDVIRRLLQDLHDLIASQRAPCRGVYERRDTTHVGRRHARADHEDVRLTRAAVHARGEPRARREDAVER